MPDMPYHNINIKTIVRASVYGGLGINRSQTDGSQGSYDFMDGSLIKHKAKL